MRAGSPVFAAVQRPFTLLGLPPKTFVIWVVICLLIFIVLTLSGSQGIGFVVMVLGIITGAGYLWRKVKADAHYETLRMLAPRFWFRRKDKSTASMCHLIAGGGLDV